MKNMQIGFGGGCYWCTEAVFQSLTGVFCVEQGFISSKAPYDAPSEAVWITYDPAVIKLSDLIEIHLQTHASDSNHKFRVKYRSAIYYQPGAKQSDSLKKLLEKILHNKSVILQKRLITLVLPMVYFNQSPQKYKNYYKNNPARAYCKTHIEPKLELLRKKYTKHVSN